jgi:hypothetical protein
MKYLIVITLLLSGCIGTEVSTGSSEVFDGGQCDLRVFQTKGMAVDKGPIKEVCVVKGTNAFTFDFTEQGAIKKMKKKVCGCGVVNAYIQSSHQESDMGFTGLYYVTLVGFKYTGEKVQEKPVETPKPTKIGKYQYSAEKLAKEHGCGVPRLLTQNPPTEMFETACSGNNYVIKCEWNECSVIK